MATPSVIAHRGAAAEAPENTIGAFDRSLALGADALELDVQRAADGTPVVIHDPTVDRTTNGEGPVAGLSVLALRGLEVPTLEEVFERYEGLEITVDVKDPAASGEVIGLIERFGRVDDTILYVEEGTETEAFDAYPGRRATSSRQAVWLAAGIEAEGGGGVALPDAFPEVVHAPLAGPEGPIVTAELVAVAQRSGRAVQVWTIDDPDQMLELREWGVDGIITNDVRLAVRLLRGDHEAS